MTERAASVTPAVQDKNVWVVAGTAYAAVDYIAVPAEWFNGYITLKADGDKWYYALSTSLTGNASASSTGVSTVASNAFALVGANNMDVLADGEREHIDLSTIQNHAVKTIILLSSTGTGHLRIVRSSGPVQGA